MATNEPNEDLTQEAGDSGSYTTIDKQSIEKDNNAIEDDDDCSSKQTTSPGKHAGCNPDDRTTNNKQDEHDHDGDEVDDDLEEGELKDDDDDDDDDEDEAINTSSNTRFSIFNNDNNNNSNSNTSGLNKEMSSGDQRLQNDSNHHNNASNYNASNDATRGSHHHRPYHRQQQQHRRHFSPNQQNHPGGMHLQNFPQNQNHFPNNGNNNLYGFQPAHEGVGGPPPPPIMLSQMNHHPVPVPMPGDMYPGGMAGNMGPVQKVNVRCRFYSKINNKCTWGDECRFEHRDESPEPNEAFNDRLVGPDGAPIRGHPQGVASDMGVHDRVYPPYRQPYPAPMPQHAYGYGPYEHPPYGPNHSNSPPLPAHPAPPAHWRQQHSPYPPTSSNHPPESVSPSILSNSNNAQAITGSGPAGRLPSTQPMSGAPVPAAPSSSGAPSPGYSSPSSSSAVYERKHRLAYEVAPWNDKGYPPSRYDRGDPASGYHPASLRGGYYRGQYGRDPYGREPLPHMAATPYPYGYQSNHPSAYRGGPPLGSHAPHYRYSSSGQRNVPPDSRRSRSNKRNRDGDSSWSDTGSDDSILGETSSSSRNHANKITKRDEYQRNQTSNDTATNKTADPELADQGGSGTPPGEPILEDRERQEMLLDRLKRIEDMVAKNREKQDGIS